jgi:hypothetical protein
MLLFIGLASCLYALGIPLLLSHFDVLLENEIVDEKEDVKITDYLMNDAEQVGNEEMKEKDDGEEHFTTGEPFRWRRTSNGTLLADQLDNRESSFDQKHKFNSNLIDENDRQQVPQNNPNENSYDN